MGNSSTGRHGDGVAVHHPQAPDALRGAWREILEDARRGWGPPAPGVAAARTLGRPLAPERVLRDPVARRRIERLARRHACDPAHVATLWGHAQAAPAEVGRRLVVLQRLLRDLTAAARTRLPNRRARLPASVRDALRTELVALLARHAPAPASDPAATLAALADDAQGRRALEAALANALGAKRTRTARRERLPEA